MASRIILWVSIIWLAPLMCFMLRNETKFKKNIVVGVTLPYEGRGDEEVIARLNAFRRQCVQCCIALLAVAVPCFLFKRFSLSFALWSVWLILCIVIPYVPYARCNADLKRIKKQRGWSGTRREEVRVEPSSVPKLSEPPAWMFALALVIALVPMLVDTDFLLIYAADAVCIVLFWVFCQYLYRDRPEQVDDDQRLTAVLTRIRRRNWGVVWISSSFCMAALNFGVCLSSERPALMLLVILAISIVTVFVVLRVEFNTRKAQETLTANSGRMGYIDDDDKWIWGILYYDPEDSKLLVNDRVGTNVSLNIAKPAGKVVMLLVALILLVMPFIGPLSITAADKPPELLLSDSDITAVSGRTRYSVAIADVAEVRLLEALPDNLRRTNGTGLENLLKGKFSAPSIGSLTLCLDPGVTPFVMIVTTDGATYLFGCRNSARTVEVYEAVTG